MEVCVLAMLLMCPLLSRGEAECSEQHFCSCPPFLSPGGSGRSHLHFTKHNYGDQYAIIGKSKELHCCLGPDWDSLQWSKDGETFPWGSRDRNAILYSENQTLIIMEVKERDSGIYKCEARRGNSILDHSTSLLSFPGPVFAHPPIWNSPPSDVTVSEGEPAVLTCSATVGQQYNTVNMEPVHAAWVRFGREVEDISGQLSVKQTWTDDDIVTHLSLLIVSAEVSDSGEWRCRVQTEYGEVEAGAELKVIVEEMEQREDDVEEDVLRQIQGLLRKQLKIYGALTRISQTNPENFLELIKEAENKLQ